MVWCLGFVTWLFNLLEGVLAIMDAIVEDLVQKWKIEDSKDLEIVRLEDLDQLSMMRFWLVGRLLTSKPFSASSLLGTMKRIWKTRDEVMTSEWNGSDSLLFYFRTASDRNMVMKGGPWRFNNAMLLLSPSDGKTDPTSVRLESQNF